MLAEGAPQRTRAWRDLSHIPSGHPLTYSQQKENLWCREPMRAALLPPTTTVSDSSEVRQREEEEVEEEGQAGGLTLDAKSLHVICETPPPPHPLPTAAECVSVFMWMNTPFWYVSVCLCVFRRMDVGAPPEAPLFALVWEVKRFGRPGERK